MAIQLLTTITPDKIIYHGDFIITLHGDGTFSVKTK